MAKTFSKEAQAGSNAKTPKAEKAEKVSKEKTSPKAPKAEKAPKESPKSLIQTLDLEVKSIKVDWTENGRTKTEKNPERWLRAQVTNSTLPTEIARQGLLMPLIVKLMATGEYWLVNGFRRYMSIKLLLAGDIKDSDGNKLTFKDSQGGTKVSVIVVPEGTTAQDLILLELAYNSQVEWEAPARCAAIQTLLQSGLSEVEISDRTGLRLHLVSRYVEIAKNPAALAALNSSDAARKSSDVFNAALEIQLPPKRLSETVVLEAAKASRQETVANKLNAAVGAAVEKKVEAAASEGITLDAADVQIGRREMDKIKSELPEPTPEELSKGFEKIIAKAEEIGSGTVTVAAVTAAVDKIQEESGLKFKKESPRTATVAKPDHTSILNMLGGLRHLAQKSGLKGWLEPDPALGDDENPYVLMLGVLIDVIVKGDLDQEAAFAKIAEADGFLKSPQTPGDI